MPIGARRPNQRLTSVFKQERAFRPALAAAQARRSHRGGAHPALSSDAIRDSLDICTNGARTRREGVMSQGMCGCGVMERSPPGWSPYYGPAFLGLDDCHAGEAGVAAARWIGTRVYPSVLVAARNNLRAGVCLACSRDGPDSGRRRLVARTRCEPRRTGRFRTSRGTHSAGTSQPPESRD